jgi:glycogen phosphorylase
VRDPKAVTVWSKINGVDELAELALNLHWSWNHASDELWKRLDQETWEATQNPWVILQTVSKEKIEAALALPEFRKLLAEVISKNRQSYASDAWFHKKHPDSPVSIAAYFSMEFMLSEALPIYSGGLGNVAGDQMKAASDLGIPVVGVGLLYGQGYFRQDFDWEGNQQALYPVNDPGQLPIRPLRHANGEWLRLSIQMPGSKVWVRCWEVSVGRTKLYLLDTNDFANSAAHRGISSQLYGGDVEMRLKQEIVLGIGGWRLLEAVGLKPEVCHLNEGHAAFAVLERARSYMESNKVSFDVALTVTRAGNVFTTHTAVTAGFDRFSPDLIHNYLGYYALDELAIPIETLLAMGRENAADASEFFNMAYLAVHGSGRVNGVSSLHGQVSRQIFQPLFPRWPQEEVPVGSVTNGIHVPTWDSAGADALWTTACGQKRWHGDSPVDNDIRQLTDEQLWQMRNAGRKALIDFVRKRYGAQLASEGKNPTEAEGVFSQNALTVGFARRFATYKRTNLLLHDTERLIRLLSDSQRPLQLILAGKAHPQDQPGQALIKQWNDFIKRPEVRSRVVFLSDYDMLLAQELVHGVDLWINTPRRPWEACGTSGMKVLANGGLNLSELDGWWAEAYSPGVGWAIGDGAEHGEDPAWDAAEAEAMYSLLEREVVPEFYELPAVSEPGKSLPSKWLGRVRESMARLTPQFSASRAIREYAEEHYIPAASAYKQRSAANSELGRSLLSLRHKIDEHWSDLQFGGVSTDTRDGFHYFKIEILSGGLNSDEFQVELYANPVPGEETFHVVNSEPKPDPDLTGLLIYSIEISASRPMSDYTVRIVPSRLQGSVPLESNQILWQR